MSAFWWFAPFFSFCYFCVFAVSFSFSASDMLLIELAVCCILLCASLAVCDASSIPWSCMRVCGRRCECDW